MKAAAQKPTDTITQAEYRAFQQAYDFNGELFAGSLPPVLVTLQRHSKAYGYFSRSVSSGAATRKRPTSWR